MIGVYQIRCKANGFRYIGGSKRSIENRISVHLFHLRNGTHPNSFLQIDWSKYTATAFAFEIIKLCTAVQVILEEQKLITKWLKKKKCYNIQPFADSPIGSQRTPEQRAATQKAAIKRCTPEWRAAVSARVKEQHKRGKFGRATWSKNAALRMAAKMRGKKGYWTDHEYPEDVKKRISNKMKGVPKTPEHIANLSGVNHWNYGGIGTMRGRKWTEEQKARARANREARKREN